MTQKPFQYYVHLEGHHAALDEWGKWAVEGPFSSPREARARAEELRRERPGDFRGKLGVSVYLPQRGTGKPIRIGDLDDVESGRVDPTKVKRQDPSEYYVHHKAHHAALGEKGEWVVDGPFSSPQKAWSRAEELRRERPGDFKGELGVSEYRRGKRVS